MSTSWLDDRFLANPMISLSIGERAFRDAPHGSVAVRLTAAFGATSLPGRVLVNDRSRNPQRPLNFRRGNGSSCPIAVIAQTNTPDLCGQKADLQGRRLWFGC
jgi:hypothetical protein